MFVVLASQCAAALLIKDQTTEREKVITACTSEMFTRREYTECVFSTCLATPVRTINDMTTD